MKSVLCYGNSNTWGVVPMSDLREKRRFDFYARWPGVVQQRLRSRVGKSSMRGCRVERPSGLTRYVDAICLALTICSRASKAINRWT